MPYVLRCTLYSLHYSLYSTLGAWLLHMYADVQCTNYIILYIRRTSYVIQYTTHTIRNIMYDSARLIVQSVHYTPYTVHCTRYSVYVYVTQCTLYGYFCRTLYNSLRYLQHMYSMYDVHCSTSYTALLYSVHCTLYSE